MVLINSPGGAGPGDDFILDPSQRQRGGERSGPHAGCRCPPCHLPAVWLRAPCDLSGPLVPVCPVGQENPCLVSRQ